MNCKTCGGAIGHVNQLCCGAYGGVKQARSDLRPEVVAQLAVATEQRLDWTKASELIRRRLIPA